MQLKRLKGSDASWRHDIEPPSHHVEYYDDEEERNLRKAKKEERRVMQGIADSISGTKPAETQRYFKVGVGILMLEVERAIKFTITLIRLGRSETF